MGAAAGILAGGGAAIGAVLITVLGPPLTGWPATLVAQPAAWTVPLAFTVMVVVSLATRRRVPADVGATMLRLHAPESAAALSFTSGAFPIGVRVRGVFAPLRAARMTVTRAAHTVGSMTRRWTPRPGAARAGQAVRRQGRRGRRRPRRAGRLVLRPARAQRRRQDHHPVDGGRPAAARRGPGLGARPRRLGRPGRRPSGCSACCPTAYGSSTGSPGAELLAYHGLLRGMDPAVVDQRAGELLDVLALADAGRTLVVDYSAGMKKKIGLACALLHAPAAAGARRAVRGGRPGLGRADPRHPPAVRRRRRHGVFSSHVMEVVERLCSTWRSSPTARIKRVGTLDEVRGERSLEDVFVEVVGGRTATGEELAWL